MSQSRKRVSAEKNIPSVKPRRAASARAAAKPALAAAIDYPRDGEAVFAGHYAVRVSAPGAAQAQVKADAGPWWDCREAVGYFWWDWSAEPGERELLARARRGKGRWVPSAARRVRVSTPA